MPCRWTSAEDTAVKLADSLDYAHGGRRLHELAERLGRTEAAVRQRRAMTPDTAHQHAALERHVVHHHGRESS